jgi:hypothetical protein
MLVLFHQHISIDDMQLIHTSGSGVLVTEPPIHPLYLERKDER